MLVRFAHFPITTLSARSVNALTGHEEGVGRSDSTLPVCKAQLIVSQAETVDKTSLSVLATNLVPRVRKIHFGLAIASYVSCLCASSNLFLCFAPAPGAIEYGCDFTAFTVFYMVVCD